MAASIEVKSGSYGTIVLTNGTATTATAIDLTGVSVSGDTAILIVRPENTATTSRSFTVWKDAGSTELAKMDNVANGSSTADIVREFTTVMLRVSNPATSLYYSWSGSVSTGADIYVAMNLKGIPLV